MLEIEGVTNRIRSSYKKTLVLEEYIILKHISPLSLKV